MFEKGIEKPITEDAVNVFFMGSFQFQPVIAGVEGDAGKTKLAFKCFHEESFSYLFKTGQEIRISLTE